MKIAVMGSQCVGKTTFIKDFIDNWGMYSLCDKVRYSELIAAKNLKLNEEGNEDSQKIILDSLIDQVMYSPKPCNIIFDRSVLDNLVYTMWLNAKGKVSDSFVETTIKLVKESLVFYDILLFLPITSKSPVPFEPGTNRSNSIEYRSEIDNIFKALNHQYNKGSKTFFPFDHKDGCPAIIEIFGNRQERIELSKLYIQEDGGPLLENQGLILPDDPKLTDFK